MKKTMRRTTLFTLFTLLALPATAARAQACRYAHDGAYALPDPHCTPGRVNQAVVANPDGAPKMIGGVEYDICAKGFVTKPFRKTTASMKRDVCGEYGAVDCPDPAKGEIDHLVPLELGGMDTVQNLWWQPAPSYHVKDRQVEDKLKPLVCRGTLTLAQAQACVVGDWVKCAARVKALERRTK